MTGERRWYLPREVAELLGIPSSTLRTYAANFGPLLSDRARPDDADGKGYRHRRYDDADLRVLREAKDLLDAGMSYHSVLVRLGSDNLARPAPRRRRPIRSHPRSVPVAPVPVAATPDPPSTPKPPSQISVEGIDELRAAIQSLSADLAASRSASVAPPAIDPNLIAAIAALLNQTQARLERLETQLAAMAAPPARPGWLARLLGRG